ncbi:MAG TPA: Hsp20/alpha crystallin family protein [Nocardioidaceae bacterium]|nr:Hsp20/alpha crystallin family protein [Nocardioidaceae bacterium]
MSTLMRRRTNPLADMLGWLDAETPFGLHAGGTPFVRIEDYIEDDTYVLRAEMPGIDPDKDLEISIDGDVLTISGERREEKKERNRQEFHYGSFSRSVTMPRHVRDEEIHAEYADGVLTLRVPFDGPTVEPRKVPVQRPEHMPT